MADPITPAPAAAPIAPVAAPIAPAPPAPAPAAGGPEPLFKPNTPAPAAAGIDDKPLSLDGIAVTRRGDIYFGHIEDEKPPGRVQVTVPTAEATVRTIRHLNRADIVKAQPLTRVQILALAKIGPYVLTQAQVDQVIKPAPPAP